MLGREFVIGVYVATIKTVFYMPLHRHCQGEAHTHLVVTRNGRVVASGRGLGMWVRRVGSAISEIPVNAQSAPMSFQARTRDFQDVTISGEIWYTISDPGTAAERFDFSLNTQSGNYNADPLTVIQGALVTSAQEAVWSHVSGRDLEEVLAADLAALSDSVAAALAKLDIGLAVSRAVVTGVRPERKVEQSLQAKTRERLQMQADTAGFERRTRATEQERAIAEAELNNKLALAKRQAALIAQQDANARAEAESRAAVERIAVVAATDQADIRAEQSLRVQRQTMELNLENLARQGKLEAQGLEAVLKLHEAHPAGSESMSWSKIPETLKNVQVLTMGDGGWQSALERIARSPSGG